MKKFVIFFIIFGLSLCSFAQGGLFGFGDTKETGFSGSRGNNESFMSMPEGHGLTTDSNATAPLGGGALLLIGFGTAYALKKRKGEK